MSRPVYLDHASAAPLHPAAREALLAAYDQGWADPTRLYAAARKARLLLDDSRARAAAALGASPAEVTFTSSGSAANRLAVAGLRAARRRVGRHAVVSAVEHSSLLDAVEPDAALVAVDDLGRVSVVDIGAAIRDDTALVAVQAANQEVGTLQGVAAIHAGCAERGVPLLVDAAAAVGHVALPPYDVLTASARKWGGPPGVGVLVVRKATRFRRPEPEAPVALPAVLAAVAGLEAALFEQAELDDRLRPLVERLRLGIPERIADVEVAGDPEVRLPHLLTVSFLYVDGEALVTELDRLGFAVSSGSACTADTRQPSHVLVAMGVLTHGNIRISLGRDSTEAEVVGFLDALPDVVSRLRALTGAPS